MRTPTPEQHRTLLVGNWLKRYAAIYPMYGKTLADFPERFDEFLDEFKTTSPDVLDEAFRLARGACAEFPTPADVRKQIVNVKVPQELLDAAYERFTQRILAQPEVKMLKSVLDEPTPKRHEITPMSEEKLERRFKVLVKQAEEMKSR